MPTNPPALTTQSTRRVDAIIGDMRANLLVFSERTAATAKHDDIQCTDVEKALLALKRAGLEDPPPKPDWKDRPTTHIGVGSMIFGFAPSVSGFAYNLVSLKENPVVFCVCVLMLPSLLAGVGATLAVLGFKRDE
jgi:hypothetical protein